MKAVSTMSGSEMPSMPRWYQALTAPIQGSRSTNCSAGVVRSNAHQSGTHRRERRERRGERDPAAERDAPVAQQQHDGARRDGQPDEPAQDVLPVPSCHDLSSSQPSSSDRPMIMAKA